MAYDHQYDSISGLIAPEIVISFIARAFLEGPAAAPSSGDGEMSAEELAARRFVRHFEARNKQASVEGHRDGPLVTGEDGAR